MSLQFINYFFLCDAQNFDFPDAEFLHCVPSLVFAAHFAFFAVAIFPPCYSLDRFYHIKKYIGNIYSLFHFTKIGTIP